MISFDDLQHVDLSGLRHRLLESGWTPMKRDGVLRAPTGKYYTLPSSLKDELDYVSLSLLIESILMDGKVQSLDELNHRIEGFKTDLLRIGCEVTGIKPGLIPASVAPGFYRKTSNFLRSSSVSLQVERDQTAKGGIYERFMYGRTKEASYMVEVHVPVDTIPDPIGRAFVKKTVAAVESLREAVRRDDENMIVNAPGAGWSAAMCESVIEFVNDPNFSTFKVQALPDRIWPDPDPIETGEIAVPLKGNGAGDLLARASARLRGLKQSQYEEVVGIPYASRDESVIGQSDRRTVSILWRRVGSSPVKVRAELSREAYEMTLASQSKRLIHVRGWLRQERGRWVLEVDGLPTLLDEMDAKLGEADPFTLEEKAIIDDLTA